MTDTRSSSALFKRAEQLKRWEESETNRKSAVPKKPSKIKFSTGCVFLAACTAGDKDEVLRLLKLGADIDTANVDGLTALHQACIDDNLDMVEFLVSRGADVNRGDNEGWTPLHATASCGFLSIARFLLESGGDVAAVNYDGELAVDIAESDEMEDMLRKIIVDKDIDCDMAREAEERIMVQHLQTWMLTESPQAEEKHPKTGATPLHVAAAKGYIKVLNGLLSKCRVEVDPIDFDGWTPLHAAALWGQKEAASILIQHGADLDMKNYAGQTCFDLVDEDMAHTLEELRKTVGPNNNTNNANNRQKRGPPPRADPPSSKLKKVEVQITSRPSIIQDAVFSDKKNSRNNSNEQLSTKLPITSPTQPSPIISDGKPPKVRAPSPEVTNEENTMRINTEEAPSWRRPASFRSRLQSDNPRDSKTSPTNPQSPENETILRRTHSFENDKTFYQRYRDVTARIKASSCPILPPIPPQHISPAEITPKKQSQTDDHLLSLEKINDQIIYRKDQPDPKDKENTWTSPSNQNIRSSENVTSNSAPNTPVALSTTPTKLSPGNIFKNFFKSFVPPVRDEESETQRKAHAKRVRETRRSTQGVTLDEIKSAEQFVKKNNSNTTTTFASEQLTTSSPICTKRAIAATSTVINSISLLMSPSLGSDSTESGGNTASQPSEPKDKRDGSTDTLAVTLPLNNTGISATATIATGGPERRPSWRLRVDPGCKFELEEVNKDNARAPSPRLGGSAATDTTVTLPLRRTSTASTTTNTSNDTTTPDDEKEPSPDSRPAVQGSNMIQRRRRPKRRSTGVGVVDMDDIINDRAGSTDGEEQDSEKTDSGEANEKRVSREQLENAAPIENGNLDYKALWEASQAEVKRLRDIVKSNEQQLRDARSTIERVTHVNQNSLTELEKREKRAMERKLSEMEEELKLQHVENQKLKDENGALIRVISKLSK